MKIGVLKEFKPGETRIGLTPDGAEELTKKGHKVLIEDDAGGKAGFPNDYYVQRGGLISQRYAICEDIVVKVKEPVEEEYDLLPLLKHKILFAYLHPAANKTLTEKLMENSVIGISYDCIEDAKGNMPLLEPMSIIAGNLAVEYAARYLQIPEGGKGKSLMSIPGLKPAKVVIMGGGTVGSTAATKAAGLGADVTLFDNDYNKIRELQRWMPANVKVLYPNRSYLKEEIKKADVLIGAVLVRGAKAPEVVDKELVKSMEDGSVIIDVSIDQGGCIWGAKPTTHLTPTYVLDGKIYCCISNMPAAVGRDSTIALTNNTLPYIIRLASENLEDIIKKDPGFAKGVVTYKRKLTNKAVADSLGLEYTKLEDLCKSR